MSSKSILTVAGLILGALTGDYDGVTVGATACIAGISLNNAH